MDVRNPKLVSLKLYQQTLISIVAEQDAEKQKQTRERPPSIH
jgi:hypothetical protein